LTSTCLLAEDNGLPLSGRGRDAWTNNLPYVGRRTTGTGAGAFLLVPPWPKEPTRPDSRWKRP
jgi:hypothetical protein